MSSPSSPALQELYQLDISSPNFGDMLCNALYKREYEQCVPIIGDGDLAWLVGYLDKVRRYVVPPHLPLKSRHSLSTILNVREPRPASVCESSDAYAGSGACSQHPTRFRPKI